MIASTVLDVLGNAYDTTTDAGSFWVGFGVGMFLLGFRIIKRMAVKVGNDYG